MRTSSAALYAVLLGLALLAARAAPAADYEVEVIVFRHVGAAGGEWKPPAAGLPDFAAARRLADADANPPPPFTRLPPAMRRLAGVAKLLSRRGAYELLVHEAWRQPGNAGVPVHLVDLAPPAVSPAPTGPRAEGSVLLLESAARLRAATDFVVLAQDVPVRVQATRDLRPGELHYLDHELLGILLQVTEVLPPTAAPAAALSR